MLSALVDWSLFAQVPLNCFCTSFPTVPLHLKQMSSLLPSHIPRNICKLWQISKCKFSFLELLKFLLLSPDSPEVLRNSHRDGPNQWVSICSNPATVTWIWGNFEHYLSLHSPGSLNSVSLQSPPLVSGLREWLLLSSIFSFLY